ncbi:MAG: tRNA pseudouridine(55) synthase TruB [Wenzhouxiangellaceae bacterium]|nr:tRNA pseudouridine(55) synthase TruB [Wenzhouxiangellaceae bacterium]
MSTKPTQSAAATSGGILLLDKPLGLTSNAALGRAKRVLGIRKAGHTGALDPLATGLLPLCFGQATKVSGFLLDADKGYLAEIKLGETTASGDAEGEVTGGSEVPELGREQIEQVLERFRGPIEQVPPMYSALKHQGRRLHELARAGIEVERKARNIMIYRLDLLDFQSPRLSLRVHCSKGTYIRSLAMDIGQALGCGAHLVGLRREFSGPFALKHAISLEALEQMDSEQARSLLLPPDAALPETPSVELQPAQGVDIGHGKVVDSDQPAAELVRIYCEKQFLGLGSIDALGRLRSRRLFLD